MSRKREPDTNDVRIRIAQLRNGMAKIQEEIDELESVLRTLEDLDRRIKKEGIPSTQQFVDA